MLKQVQHDGFHLTSPNLLESPPSASRSSLVSPYRMASQVVAAWFEEGRADPKLRLIRFEPESAQIWLNENSLFAGVKMLLGADPKEDYADKVAEVEMGGR